jgi:hypothetical protein
MTANRTNWFEAFENIVQFYPKLTATIAFGAIAAAGRMIPRSGVPKVDTPAKVLQAATLATLPERPKIKHVSARKVTKHVTRKVAKRSPARRRKFA